MESSDTVDCMRADNGEVSHSNLLWPSFFNKRHSHDLLIISWVLLLQFSQVNMVDQINELQMSWQKSSNQLNRPLLESLWQNSMVSVREGVVDDVPSLFKGEHLLIDQDSKKLDGGNGWMGIVQLNLVKICKLGKSIVVLSLVSPDNIVDGG